MRVRVLGSIEAENSDPVPLGGPTQRRILAMLALDAGDIVALDRLVDAIWVDGDLPANAERNVRTYVHRLRTAFGDGHADLIETAPPGYRLLLDGVLLDSKQFEDLASRADRLAGSGDLTKALETIEEAEGLWRGRPFGEFADEQWAMSEAERLTELHVGLREIQVAALLATGRAGAAVEAEALAREFPLRERPRSLLMQALYHSGRQAEALRAFQDYRALLIEEIGVEPSTELTALDQAIAAGNLHLDTPTRTVGAYELHDKIGEGAFAIVYRGTQTGLDRDVAIKAIRAELANHADFIRSFEAEAQMVAHLEHPHIVPLYDFWREPDRAFLVMRWLTGGTLQTNLAEGPWTLQRTTQMVQEIGSALTFAHHNGVIHRDVKPGNVLLDDEDLTYLTDFGIALEAEPASPSTDVAGLAACAREALGGDQPHSADAAVIPAAVGATLDKASAADPGQRYQDVAEFVAAFTEAGTLGDGLAAGQPSAPPLAPEDLENPYKGLRAFGEGDADDFFGRDGLIEELVERMAGAASDAGLLAVVGPSGSGKSSLVRAGLVPALRDGAVDGSDRWFVTTMVPGVDPFEELETALLRVAVNPPTSLRSQLADGDRGIHRSVRRVLPDDSTPLLLVIDQFEELFTLCEDDELRGQFLLALATAVTDPNSPLRVVLTLRADFYDRPLRHSEFATLVKQNTVTVTPLAGTELEQAIVDPAARQGVEFEPGLVAELITAAGNQPGSLPLLQYTLTELFDTNVSGLLLQDSYNELGGLTGALARRADDIYNSSPPEQQQATRRLFGRLITLGEGNEDTRRRVLLSELSSDPATEASISRYGDARLLTFDRDPETREPTVEVAHEALIREWPRLRTWVEEDRQGLRVHRHLTTSAGAWAERGRDDGDLYRGVRLDAAESWIDAAQPALNDLETEFLATSTARRDAEAEADRKRTRRLRRLLVTTAIVAIIALIAGAFAIREQRRADDEASKAQENASLADERADEAANNAELAATSASSAEAALAAGDVERLRAVAVATAPTTSETAALLAVEAYLLDPSNESLSVLQQVLTARPGFKGNIEAGPYSNGELLDDGVTFVVAGREMVDVWDLDSRVLLHSIPHPTTEGDATLGISSDGSVAAVRAGSDQTAVYNALSGETTAELQHDSPTSDLAVSPDGALLAVAQLGGTVEIWDLSSQELSQTIATGADDVRLIAWTPDGESLAAVTDLADVQLWRPGTEEPVWMAGGPESDQGVALVTRPNVLLFSSDGSTLLVDSGAFGSQIRVFDVIDGNQPYPPTFRSTTGATVPGDLLFWRDEAALTVVAPGDSDIRVYDLTTGESEPLPSTVPNGSDWSYSEQMDVVVAATGSIQFWSLDGTGPLERRVPYSPDQQEALDAFGGNIYTSLNDAATELLVSVVALPGTPGAMLVDLDDARMSSEIISSGLSVSNGFGSYTWWVGDPGMQMLDDSRDPLGPPVPFAFDTSDVKASLDGRFFALSRFGGLVNLYRGDGELVEILDMGLPPSFEGIIGVSLTADGELLLAQANEFTVMWRTEDLEEVPIEVPDDWVFAILAGDWLFATIEDGSIQRFDPLTLEPVGQPFIGHNAGAGQYEFDESMQRLATLGLGDGVRVWDMDTAEPLGREVPGRPISIELSQDGRTLTTAVDDGVSLWNYDTENWAEIACEMAGRNLNEEEWEQLGPRTIERRATCPQYPL